MRKEDVDACVLRELLVGVELFAVVDGEGSCAKTLERRLERGTHLMHSLTREMPKHRRARLAIDDAEHTAALLIADDEVTLAVPEASSLCDDGRSLVDADAIARSRGAVVGARTKPLLSSAETPQ